jgi:ATP-dependent RNA helicase DeaD
MGLADPILKAVSELGFTEPTPIQEKVIPHLIGTQQDLIALAQTGTGKTAAFGLPLIQNADMSDPSVQALILCPTRELCMQITGDLQDFSKYTNDFHVIPVYGGAPIDKQIQKLRRGGQIVVGTPGRVRDLIERKVLKIEKIRWLVLDEADEMLQMGFKEELDAILGGTPKGKQTLLFSATMPQGVYRIANEYMNAPLEIAVGTKNAGAENVQHDYYMAHAKNRYEVLKRIADMHPDIYGIVFCRTRQETKDVAEKFMNDGYNADALHGDLSQAQRDYVMNRFRKRQLQMLVATDVAARGLDVNDLTHVINYNLPDDLEVYIHRSGRTGRAGKSGTSITIIHTRETGKIRELEKITKKKFQRVMIPGGKEICKKQLFNLVSNMEKVETADKEIDQFLPEIYKKLEWLSKEELIKKFVSVEFNRFLDYYKNAPDLNVEADKRGDRNERNDRRVDRDGSRSGHSDRRSRGGVLRGEASRGDAAERMGDRNDWSESSEERASRKEKRSNRSDIRSPGSERNGRGGNAGESGYSRFYINLGSKNDVNPVKLIGLLMDTTNNRQINVGKIDIMKGFSFFEVEKQYEDLVFRSFSRDIRHEGTKVKVEISEGNPAITKRTSSVREWKDSEALGGYSGYKKKDSYKSDSKKRIGDKKKHRKGVSRK